METRLFNGYKQFNYGNGWIFTHRAVAQKMLGKNIPEDYEVHHVNGDKLDNRPENLAVLSRDEHQKIHSSQRKDSSYNGSSYNNCYFDYILSNMVALDYMYLENSVIDLVVLESKISMINCSISTIERTIREINKLNDAFKVAFSSTEQISEEYLNDLKECYKDIENLTAEKEVLSQKILIARGKFNQNVEHISDKYSKLAMDISSSLSGIFGNNNKK